MDCDVVEGAHRPLEEQEGLTATSVTHAASLDSHPSVTTSHRFPHQAFRSCCHVVNVGRRQDSALHVQLSFSGELYNHYMPALVSAVRGNGSLVGLADVRDDDFDK